jgi:multidrug efflux system outer membrane protein
MPDVPSGVPLQVLERRPDILQAEQQLFPSELNLAQTRAATFSSLVSIYQAMGGGWVVEAEKLTVQTGNGDTPKEEREKR